MYGLRLARRLHAPLWIVRPERAVNTALYELAADGVTIKVFGGWTGRLLLRAFLHDHLSTILLTGMGGPKRSILYGTPFYFLVLARVQGFGWPAGFSRSGEPLSVWMTKLWWRWGKFTGKTQKRFWKAVRRTGKRMEKARKRIDATVHEARHALIRKGVRVRKKIRTFRKRMRAAVLALAHRLKRFAVARGGKTGTVLIGIRNACFVVADWVHTPKGQPNSVPIPAATAEAGVVSTAVSEPAQENSPSLAGGVLAPAAGEPSAELAPAVPEEQADASPALALAPAETSREDRSGASTDGVVGDASPSADKAPVEPEEAAATCATIDLYRAKELSPARAIGGFVKKKVNNNPTYYKRLWLAQAPRGRIPADLLPSLAAEAEKRLGIDPKARLVGLHVRESGFKAGREVHEVKPQMQRNDAVRNVSVTNYRLALDFLARRGFTIVRIGDLSMSPLNHSKVIDLARLPVRTDWLEAYCVERSECFIGCESGPAALATMFGKPHLVLNASDPLAGIPIRAEGIFTLQAVREIATGRVLRPLDMFFPEYLHGIRNTKVYDYFENSPEDVLAAVEDLIEIVDRGVGPETPEQREFRLWALSVGVRMRLRNSGVCKWGPHRGYLGGGRLAPSFARKYLGPQLAAHGNAELSPPDALARVS